MNFNETAYNAFEKEMRETYPKIFSQPFGGFAVGPGWWPLIKTLCHLIQSHIDWKNNRAEKYPDLMYKPVEQVVAHQIKEKFGGLRFYYDGGNDIIAGMVTMAEEIANQTCETCGSPGRTYSSGWVRTLCEKHEQERLDKK